MWFSTVFSGKPARDRFRRVCLVSTGFLVLVSCVAAIPFAANGDSLESRGEWSMNAFDIAPFALPNTPKEVIRFEEPRDVSFVKVRFEGELPEYVGLSYLHKTWPEHRAEDREAEGDPFRLGWIAQDDWFNVQWREAAIEVAKESDGWVRIEFKGLAAELADQAGYDVRFRRTLGVRIEVENPETILEVAVFTRSAPKETLLRVESDAAKKVDLKTIHLSGYNARIEGITAVTGVETSRDTVELSQGSPRVFEVVVRHMEPVHAYCGDQGLVTFEWDGDAFTISLPSLEKQGPIWAEPFGFFITQAEDSTTFADYRARIEGERTLNQRVLGREEQSYAGAFYGQPHPHTDGYHVGCKHARQRFRLQVNGDVVLHKGNVARVPGKDTDRFKCERDARFFFGLEDWFTQARFPDPEPVLVYNLCAKQGDLLLEQKALAVPLMSSMLDGSWSGDDTMAALVRLRFENAGEVPVLARLPVRYSQKCGRTGFEVPDAEMDALALSGNRVFSEYEGTSILRFTVDTGMQISNGEEAVEVSQSLQPGETCEAVVKIPYISLESEEELQRLESLNFEECYRDVRAYWRKEANRGASLKTPDPQLEALHKSHLVHVLISDFEMPDGSGLVNTSVGTSTYGNYSNESCMIVDELEGRGLHEEARKRLELWVKYQSTVPQPGNFTDYDGMYYGAGGFENGHYNQHHGWVLWALSRHYFFTRDKRWFEGVAGSVIAAADWVFRQRKNTLTDLPHSRGWERGFLPAGSLEDVTDFYYWLSTNALTWRGTEWAARALEATSHPEANRIRREADAYRKDLVKGFETMRRQTPLVRLRDGRWVPDYPSRLYRRGRETGWIRETLEGSVYLLISGLYDPKSEQGAWILDDFQDNRYVSPPFGYLITEFERNWFARGGLSMQPNLLAGLVPHLDRDEPEIYVWMFYNSWVSCYRQEMNAMIEHPAPVLGFTNHAYVKTSDEANAVAWLRKMFVYDSDGLLHLGRAIPRAWFAQEEPFETREVATVLGRASVRYEPSPNNRSIKALVDLDLFQEGTQVLVRFRTPEKQEIRTVLVNGENRPVADPERGDVDITGMTGKLEIVAGY